MPVTLSRASQLFYPGSVALPSFSSWSLETRSYELCPIASNLNGSNRYANISGYPLRLDRHDYRVVCNAPARNFFGASLSRSIVSTFFEVGSGFAMLIMWVGQGRSGPGTLIKTAAGS